MTAVSSAGETPPASGPTRGIAGLEKALRAGGRASSKLRALSRRRPAWPARSLKLDSCCGCKYHLNQKTQEVQSSAQLVPSDLKGL